MSSLANCFSTYQTGAIQGGGLLAAHHQTVERFQCFVYGFFITIICLFWCDILRSAYLHTYLHAKMFPALMCIFEQSSS